MSTRTESKRYAAQGHSLQWAGAAVAAISIASYILFMIYSALNSVVTGGATATSSQPLALTVAGLVLGSVLFGVGFVITLSRKDSSTASEEDNRTNIAA